MTPDLADLRQLAEARNNENFRFRDFLKHRARLTSEEVDSLVSGLAERAWKKTDCATCGNCCQEVAPTLNQQEIDRLAGHLGMSSSEFISKYLKPEPTAERPWVMRERPCAFFKDNRCSVYEHRPANCRDYPYLDKPGLTARTISMIGRTAECPVVFEVWEELKRATGFRATGRFR